MPDTRPATTKIDSLSVLLDPEGQMLLAETYKGVIENVQKKTLANIMKNTDLSGDPTTGTVEAKRFVNAEAEDYGTARTAGKGKNIKGKSVTVPIDTDREFIEEIEQKDISLLGVEGLVAKRAANHAMRMAAELDAKFFAEAKTSGTQYLPANTLTEIQDIVEGAFVTLASLKTDYIDGLDKSGFTMVCDPATYSAMRMYLEKVYNTNVDTTAESFMQYHGVRVEESIRLPAGVKFILMNEGSIAQPVMSREYAAEKIPMSESYAIELFFYYGTKAVTPETILWYDGTKAS